MNISYRSVAKGGRATPCASSDCKEKVAPGVTRPTHSPAARRLVVFLFFVGWISHAALGQILDRGHAIFLGGTIDGALITTGFQGFPSTNITIEFWARS